MDSMIFSTILKSCSYHKPKCTPAEGQECPQGFRTNEDGQCSPLNEDGVWEYPDGYHSIEDDDAGQAGCPL